MEGFRECLSDCGLVDLGFVGQRYTWCNGRIGVHLTLIRLDKYVANEREEGCRKVIKEAWDPLNLNPKVQVQDRLKCCQTNLQTWNSRVFGNVNKILKLKQNRLQQLEALDLLHELAKEIQALKKEINEVMLQEEIMWNQRSRALWVKCGDRNTKFFHETASNRRRKNRIEGLCDNEGRWREDQGEVEGIILDYFKEIYSTNYPANFRISLGAIDRRVSDDMNDVLLKEFREEEVWSALKQMHPTKYPSPDGMSPIFFQKYWDVVGPQVLVNRLKKVLPTVISDAQSAFVPGRQITDNVLVAFEIMHYINQRRKGKRGLMAIKLDMSKVYDRVEWAYLEVIMRRLGFQERWICLMMMCVNMVSYSVLMNGEPKGRITPTRGLRQGDSISPYLFLLCAEGLSAMLSLDESGGIPRGISVGRKVVGWKGRLLSMAGQEILIKREKERKLAWIAWEKMCTPKVEGGMGFKDLKAFNLALLAKQGWRLTQNTKSLAYKVLKAKYFPESNFLEVQIGKKSSYTWRSLMAAKEVLWRGLRWNIGNGRRARIWADRWIPIPNSFKEDRKELDLERLACTAWCIWKNRNAAKFEGKTKQAKVIVAEANALVEEFKEQVNAPRQNAPPRTGGWTPPCEGWYKVNVYGTMFKETGCCGIGIVIRNERGLIIGAMSKKMDISLEALEVEAKAFEEGILLVGDLGLKDIVLEGDAKVVIDTLAGSSSPLSSIQMIIEGFQRWKFKVHAWEVNYVCRTDNIAAHLMARNAKFVNDSVVWVEDAPPIIECQLLKDVTGLDFCPSSLKLSDSLHIKKKKRSKGI
ncbi:hypothetical protein SO802_015636 [Lithocarpus litseifolius]|uniref:Reverse transcriptase domain-containing protein n=1 Tax=Lithocarpus litseifolius TaxID=425828 RepID=A0AAW2CYC7_9ROSI